MSAADRPTDDRAASLRTVLGRALRRRCPRCGVGAIMTGRYQIRERCPGCGLRFERGSGDQFGVMYLSTAVVTIAFFAFVITVRPTMGWPERLLFIGTGVGLMLATLPVRKSVAIAIDYWVDREML